MLSCYSTGSENLSNQQHPRSTSLECRKKKLPRRATQLTTVSLYLTPLSVLPQRTITITITITHVYSGSSHADITVIILHKYPTQAASRTLCRNIDSSWDQLVEAAIALEPQRSRATTPLQERHYVPAPVLSFFKQDLSLSLYLSLLALSLLRGHPTIASNTRDPPTIPSQFQRELADDPLAKRRITSSSSTKVGVVFGHWPHTRLCDRSKSRSSSSRHAVLLDYRAHPHANSSGALHQRPLYESEGNTRQDHFTAAPTQPLVHQPNRNT